MTGSDQDQEVEWKRRGEYWFLFVSGQVKRCVSCGQPIEHVSAALERAHHKCSVKHEAAKKAANTRLNEPIERAISWGQRLSDGCEIIRSGSDTSEDDDG